MSKTMMLGWATILASVWAESTLAQEVLIEPARVMSVVTSDWNDDGLMDRAVLYDGGAGDAALAIYFSDVNGAWGLVGFDPENAWFGGWGQQPELSLGEAGELQVRSMNIGTGRNRWQMDLTLVFMNEQFVVSTYQYEDYDSLEPENFGECSVEYLTGKGQNSRGGAPMQPFTFKASVIPLGDWSFDDVPENCS